MLTVTATEFQNNFGKYLQTVQNGDEVVILKNGKEVARLISQRSVLTFLTDQLVGVLKEDVDEAREREERLKKYEDPYRY